MAKWEFAIAVRDEKDLPSGHKRKKEGDIIAVKPYPWKWGKKEVANHLIVIADGLTREEAIALCQPHYEDGVLEQDIAVDVKESPKILGKRRYSIPLEVIKQGWEPALDVDAVRDITEVYQPLKEKETVIDFSEKVGICRDNHLGSFRYKIIKTVEVNE